MKSVVALLGIASILIAIGSCSDDHQVYLHSPEPDSSGATIDTLIAPCDTVYVPGDTIQVQVDVHWMFSKDHKGCKACHK